MAKSYKKETLELLKYTNVYEIKLGDTIIPLYTDNIESLLNNVDIARIIEENGLKGKTKPIAIIQYVTYIPWIDNIGPMLAFVWSWGGPWAFIYNIRFPDCSETGSLPLNRLKEFKGQIPSNYFNKLC